jgi:hypothetical protein
LAGYYTTSSNFNFSNSCINQITISGSGIESTFITFTGSGTPALNWQGATVGGGLKDINIKITSASVDAVNVNGIAQFIMRDVLLTGPYTGTGNAVGCFADNAKGCGLHVTAGTNASYFEKITSLEFAGDGINIDAETSGGNVFRTVIGQGDGGWNWNIHRLDNAFSGGPIYCYDCQGLGIQSVPTSGGFNITSGVLLTTQAFGLWCFECVTDGMNVPSTAVGVNASLVSLIFFSNSWIKTLSTAGAAMVFSAVQNVQFNGGFIQNGGTGVSPISVSSGASGIKFLNTLISNTSATTAVHYAGGGEGSGNSIANSTYGGLALTDDFTNSGFNLGIIGGLTTVSGLSFISGMCSSTQNAGTWLTIVDNNAACTYLGTPTGGGTTRCPVYCDGTAWKIH